MKRTGSCGIMDNFDRRFSNPISEISIPSIVIKPDVSSVSRNKHEQIDDFPAPVLPTMPERYQKFTPRRR